MTTLAIKVLSQWAKMPDGSMRRPGLSVTSNRLCLSDGLAVPHSHYAWAKDEMWALYGDLMEPKQ